MESESDSQAWMSSSCSLRSEVAEVESESMAMAVPRLKFGLDRYDVRAFPSQSPSDSQPSEG